MSHSESAAPDTTPATEVVWIEPTTGWRGLDLPGLWRYRGLMWFLALRDIQLRYRQTALGVSWCLLQPLLSMALFSLFFGRLGKIPSDGAPYPLFVLAALLPWQLFASSLSAASQSVVTESRLITKVYFPRLVIPLSSVVSSLVDFCVSLTLLLSAFAYYGVWPGWRLLAIPILMLFCVITSLSVGLWLAASNVQYRDFRYVIPFMIQSWMFASPVVYSSTLVPERFRWLYSLNPMVGVIEGFRWVLLGHNQVGQTILVSGVAVMFLLYGGGIYFRRMERTFADIV